MGLERQTERNHKKRFKKLARWASGREDEMTTGARIKDNECGTKKLYKKIGRGTTYLWGPGM